MSIESCKVISLPKVSDPRGNITFLQKFDPLPFDLKRVYYLYDVPGGASRGGHAHIELQQLIIAASGSFDVLLDDGFNKKVVQLNRAYEGLVVSGLIWRELLNFSSGAVCLVAASMEYTETDYIRDYQDFLKLAHQKK